MAKNDLNVSEVAQKDLNNPDIFTDQVPLTTGIAPGMEKYQDQGRYNYPLFINGIINQVNQGFAPIVVIQGKEGSGKTTTAIKLLKHLHNDISLLRGEINKKTIKEHLTYSVREFLERIEDKSRQGIIIDEAGINLNAKDWHSDFNRAFDQTIQTMRFKNNVYIIVIPDATDLDKSIRKKIDFLLTNKKKGIIKPVYIYQRLGGIQVVKKNSNTNGWLSFRPWIHKKPPKNLMESYKEKEIDFKKKEHNKRLEDIKEKIKEKEETAKTIDLADL